eukprot:TRINITY_DN6568_c1_g1_i1.p2 TRINITY_DN6568_c1_g1~~TRINITY_DN6568_c1_g1_i1.p2  ORF type:complete len:189 (-),score=-19.78 TRINITY_DN6568_c1_g1_i1:453-1019(-)
MYVYIHIQSSIFLLQIENHQIYLIQLRKQNYQNCIIDTLIKGPLQSELSRLIPDNFIINRYKNIKFIQHSQENKIMAAHLKTDTIVFLLVDNIFSVLPLQSELSRLVPDIFIINRKSSNLSNIVKKIKLLKLYNRHSHKGTPLIRIIPSNSRQFYYKQIQKYQIYPTQLRKQDYGSTLKNGHNCFPSC